MITSKLRNNKLRDLVYRNMEDPIDKAAGRKSHVKLVYVMGQSKASFFAASQWCPSEYKADGKSVSMEVYNPKLGSISI